MGDEDQIIEEKKGLSSLTIGGIVVGVVIILVGSIGVIVYFGRGESDPIKVTDTKTGQDAQNQPPTSISQKNNKQNGNNGLLEVVDDQLETDKKKQKEKKQGQSVQGKETVTVEIPQAVVDGTIEKQIEHIKKESKEAGKANPVRAAMAPIIIKKLVATTNKAEQEKLIAKIALDSDLVDAIEAKKTEIATAGGDNKKVTNEVIAAVIAKRGPKTITQKPKESAETVTRTPLQVAVVEPEKVKEMTKPKTAFKLPEGIPDCGYLFDLITELTKSETVDKKVFDKAKPVFEVAIKTTLEKTEYPFLNTGPKPVKYSEIQKALSGISVEKRIVFFAFCKKDVSVEDVQITLSAKEEDLLKKAVIIDAITPEFGKILNATDNNPTLKTVETRMKAIKEEAAAAAKKGSSDAGSATGGPPPPAGGPPPPPAGGPPPPPPAGGPPPPPPAGGPPPPAGGPPGVIRGKRIPLTT